MAGERGKTGRQGVQGVQGIEGVEGPLGADGLVGDTGDIGGIGPKGAKGDPGKQGPPGKEEAIHPWRWRLLTLWVIGFSTISFLAFRDGIQVDEKIQNERANAIIVNCQDQNQRHRNTVTVLDQRIVEAKRGQTSERQKQIQVSRDSTVLLLDAILPLQNCRNLAKNRVNTDDSGQTKGGNG